MSIPPPPHPSVTPPGEPPPGNFQFHGQDYVQGRQQPSVQQPSTPQSVQPKYGQQQYGQPQYPQPQYGQQPYGYRPPTSKNWMNIVSLITGIVGCFGFTGLLAVIFGHLGVAAAKRGEATNRGLGIAGLVLGYLSVILTIAFWSFSWWAAAECAADPNSYWCSTE
ncbi:MAG: DUF4190 domain-containing protein [Actinobacteria bacterium HGW-Actinobacteria-4]|nr:MAG: DUF4190 domain-containing protein [Actinobacteria bacterium HGW-Actinobacteria-4]